MKVYNYDRKTNEYIGAETVFLDNVATLREGKEVYLIPAHSTEVEPPKDLKENQVAIWNGIKWEVKEDYRGQIIYNTNTREAMLCNDIGELPQGYSLELKPSLAETKAEYLGKLKTNFLVYLNNTKITIPDLDLAFGYNSLDNIKKERDLKLTVSRDDNNKIYKNLTSEQYGVIISYLLTFGQLVYLYKWNMENTINKCKNLELLETLKDKLVVKIDMSQLTNLMRMTEKQREEYFTRIANTIK